MSDRRFVRATGRVAHDSLRGQIEGVAFVAGEWCRVSAPLADLCAVPGGARDRQLLLGARLCVIERSDGEVFGFDDADGYCGWLDARAIGPDHAVTHWVAAPATHVYPEADIKTRESAALSLGSLVEVIGTTGRFAQGPGGYIPMAHLRVLGDWLSDPVAVARGFLGTPYLWGGNSRAGIDCSGLVQVARRACGLPCPPDSDLQSAMTGAPVDPGCELPGDLVFWKGHVAMVSAPGMIIHANAWHMAVVEEPLAEAEARIAANGELVRLRLRANG